MPFDQPITTGERYCSNHLGYAPANDGQYETFNHGKNQRWVCAKCVKAKRERKERSAA